MTKAEVLLIYFARQNHTAHHAKGTKVEECRSETCREVVAALKEGAKTGTSGNKNA